MYPSSWKNPWRVKKTPTKRPFIECGLWTEINCIVVVVHDNWWTNSKEYTWWQYSICPGMWYCYQVYSSELAHQLSCTTTTIEFISVSACLKWQNITTFGVVILCHFRHALTQTLLWISTRCECTCNYVNNEQGYSSQYGQKIQTMHHMYMRKVTVEDKTIRNPVHATLVQQVCPKDPCLTWCLCLLLVYKQSQCKQ